MSNFKVGDRVKVVDIGKTYDTYKPWADENGLEGYKIYTNPSKGDIFTIKVVAPHSGPNSHEIYGIVNKTGSYIIDASGLELVESEGEYHTPQSLYDYYCSYVQSSPSWSYFSLGESKSIKSKSIKGGLMSKLQNVPNTLKRFLNQNYKAFYQLGWVSDELELNDEGVDEMDKFLFTHFEKEFGEYAQKRVKEIEAEEKKKEK